MISLIFWIIAFLSIDVSYVKRSKKLKIWLDQNNEKYRMKFNISIWNDSNIILKTNIWDSTSYRQIIVLSLNKYSEKFWLNVSRELVETRDSYTTIIVVIFKLYRDIHTTELSYIVILSPKITALKFSPSSKQSHITHTYRLFSSSNYDKECKITQ